MQRIVETNGNVTFVMEGNDRESLEMAKDRVGAVDHEFLSDMLDIMGFSGNNIYMPIKPEDVGAITDAPMFTDELSYDYDGMKDVEGDVWWFPNYQVESFADTLFQSGRVTFQKAPDN